MIVLSSAFKTIILLPCEVLILFPCITRVLEAFTFALWEEITATFWAEESTLTPSPHAINEFSPLFALFVPPKTTELVLELFPFPTTRFCILRDPRACTESLSYCSLTPLVSPVTIRVLRYWTLFCTPFTSKFVLWEA